MATQVEQRVVSMQFNNSQFESSASTTLNTLDRLKEALNFSDAGRGFSNITTAANSVNLNGLGSAIDSVRLKFSALEMAGLSVMNRLVNSAINAGASMVRSLTIAPIMDGFKEYELKMGSIQTIMANVNSTSTKAATSAASSISSTATKASKAASAANKQAQKDLKAAQKAETKAFQKQAEAELKEFNKTAQAELESVKEATSDQLETLADAHEDQLKELQKSQKAELKELKNGYSAQLDALNDELEAEMDALTDAHKEKLSQYEEEYLAKVKAVDEERYNALKAIQDQIDALEDLTDAENKARKEASQQEKLNTLQELADKARTQSKKTQTAKDLADYEAELAEERAQQERKDQIELLKDQMNDVKTLYQEKIDAARDEYDERRELENTSYTESAETLRDHYADLKESAQESYQDQLEALQEQQEARREMLNEQYATEREQLQEQLQEQLDAIQERQDAEREAIQDRQEEERDALNERHSDELDAISSAASAASSAVGGVTGEALAGVKDVNKALKQVTLEDVNDALDELNEYADKTIYSFSDMTNNIGKFVSAGVGLDDSVASIKGFSNVAALAGASAGKTSNAMYQLSQGIAAGVIQLQDWRSMETNDVNSKIFQESLMETARVHGVAIDEMLAKEGTFRLTLQHGWLTSDIMVETLKKFTGDLSDEELKAMGYTDEQIVKIQEQAKLALDAATKVRTYTQLIGTMREAVGSGWAQTFELIFGDFDEATNLWTSLNDVFSAMIDKQADERNQLLEDWKKWGGRDVLIMGFEKMWTNLQPIINAVQEGFREIIPKTTYNDLVRISLKFEEFASKMKLSESGVTNLKNTVKGIASVFALVGDAVKSFLKVFLPSQETFGGFVEGLLGITGGVGDVISGFVEGVEKGKTFEKFFQTIKDTITGAAEALAAIVGGIAEFVKALVFPTESLFIDEFADKLVKQKGPIQTVFYDILNVLTSFKDGWKSGFEALGTLASDGFGALTEGVTKLKDKILNIGDWLSGGISGVVTAIDGFFSSGETAVTTGTTKFQNAVGKVVDFVKGILGNLRSLPDVIKTIGSTLGGTIGGFIHGLIDSISFTDIFKTVTTIQSVGILNGFNKIVNGLGDIFKDGKGFFKSISKGFKNVTNAISETVKSFKQSNTAEIIKEVGKAIGILALSMIAMSLVDASKLGASMAAMTVAIGEFSLAIWKLDQIGNKSTTITKDGISIGGSSASSMIKSLGLAMLEWAAAMKLIASIDADQMGWALVSISVFAGEMCYVIPKLNEASKEAEKGGKLPGLKTFAESLIIFGISMRIIGGMEWSAWWQSMIAIGGFAGAAYMVMPKLEEASKEAEKGGDLKGLKTFAESMILFGISMRIIGGMEWGDWAKSMVALAGFTLAVNKVIPELESASKAADQGGDLKGLKTFAESLILFSISMRIVGGMEWEDWGKALLSVFGFATAATIAVIEMNKASKAADQGGDLKGLITFAESLILFGVAMRIVGGMGWGEIAKACVAMVDATALLVAAMAAISWITEQSGFKAYKIDAVCDGMIKLAAAILILTPAMMALGSMDLWSIIKALGAIAGVFTILGVSATVLAPLAPVINTLAGSIALLGVGIAGIGVGLLAFSAGLSALAVAGASVVSSALMTIGGVVSGILDILTEAVPKIGEFIVTLLATICSMIVENNKIFIDTFLILVENTLIGIKEHVPTIVSTACDIIIMICDTLREKVPELVKSIMGLVGDIITAVMDEVKNIDFSAYLKGVEGVGLLSALVVVIAGVSPLVGPAATGLLKMSALVVELTALLVAMGAINQIPGIGWLIGEGGDLMGKIGDAIGKFVGGIVGGFAEGLTDALPAIGKNLTEFMNNANEFFTGIAGFKPETAKAVGYLAEAVLILTASEFIESIASFFGGGKSLLANFGLELAAFAPGFAIFAGLTKNINPEVVQGSANAAKALAEMAHAVPNEGGWISKITGENSLSAFADELADFGPSLMAYANSVDGLKADVVTNSINAAKSITEFAHGIPNEGGLVGRITGDNSLAAFANELMLFGPALMTYSLSVNGLKADVVENSINAAKAIAEFATTLPDSGGIKAVWSGDNTLSGFAEQLAKFGPALMDYASSVDGLSVDAVTNSATAAKSLYTLVDELPPTGGVKSWWEGSQSLVGFAGQLPLFGKSMKKYSDSVQGVTPEAVVASANAAKALAELNNIVPDSGGLKGLIFGDQDLGDFGKNLTKLGEGVKGYYDQISGINVETMNAAIQEIKDLIDITKTISGMEVGNLSEFGKQLKSMGQTGVSEFVEGFTGSKDQVESAIATMLSYVGSAIEGGVASVATPSMNLGAGIATNLQTGISNGTQQVMSTVQTLVNTVVTSVTNGLPATSFTTAGGSIVTGISTGINNNTSIVQTAVQNLCEKNVVTAMKNALPDSKFKTIAKNMLDALKTGVNNNTSIVTNQIKTLCNTILNTAKNTLSSTQFNTIGREVSRGIGNGIDTYSYQATNAASNLATNVRNAVSNGLSYSTFTDLARNVVSGLTDGINSQKQSAVSAAKRMAKEVSDAMGDTLQVNSPSKVTRRIGGFAGLGLVLGLTDEIDRVSKASIDLGASAVDPIDEAITRISESMGDINSDFQPTITPVVDLRNIDQAAGYVNSRFGNLGIDATSTLAQSVSGGFNSNRYATQMASDERMRVFEDRLSELNTALMKDDRKTENINTFYIRSTDPKQAAEEVGYIMQHQVERRKAVWAK